MKMGGGFGIVVRGLTGGAEGGCVWCCEPVPEFAPGGRWHHRLRRRWASAHSRVTSHGHLTPTAPGGEMDVIYARCWGVDVHKKMVVACRITPGPTGTPHKEIREFTTMSADI